MPEEATPLPDARTVEPKCNVWSSLGLLALRLGVGLNLALLHGWDKLIHFGDKADKFPDPIGFGSAPSLALLTGAEFFCAVLVVVGLLTRWAAIPIIIAMAVAAFLFHAQDPWARKELALLYLTPCVTLLLCGGGRLSLDALIFRRAKAKP